MPETVLLYLLFDQKIKAEEIQCFRGAIIKHLGKESTPLLHNHKDHGLRYGYPLVQYKLQNGHPQIIAFNDAIAELRPMLSENPIPLQIGKKEMQMSIQESHYMDYTPEIQDAPKYYALKDYIPLTGNNVAKYESMLALTDKICLLEDILVGNILSFFKGIGYHADEKIEVAITSLEGQDSIRYKGVSFKTFHLHFVSNVQLPDGIGLGKSPSIGFGTLKAEKLPDQIARSQYQHNDE